MAAPRADHSLLSVFLSLKLSQLEEKHGGFEPFVAKIGVSKGTYYMLAHDKGNPRFETIERIAASLNMSVYELLGFDREQVREAFARNELPYDAAVRSARKQQISLFSLAFAHKLQMLEARHGGYKVFLKKIGISKGAYYELGHAKGNPTFRTVERIARGLKTSVYDLLGFTEEEAAAAYRRMGLDYHEMAKEIVRRNKPYKVVAQT